MNFGKTSTGLVLNGLMYTRLYSKLISVSDYINTGSIFSPFLFADYHVNDLVDSRYNGRHSCII